jgi:hypothetical protein
MNNPIWTWGQNWWTVHCFAIFYWRPRIRNEQGNSVLAYSWTDDNLTKPQNLFKDPTLSYWCLMEKIGYLACSRLSHVVCVYSFPCNHHFSVTHEDTNLALFRNPFKDLPIVNRGHGSSSCFHLTLNKAEYDCSLLLSFTVELVGSSALWSNLTA